MLNLPKKIFLMKANLNKKKIKINNYFIFKKKILNFFLLNGPPFANGELHIGHMLNNTIKDVFMKIFNNYNFLLLSNLGWDSHGLPIEQLNKINNIFFLKCRYFVCKTIKLQKKNINNFYFFNKYYLYNTMEPRYESIQYKVYNLILLKKIIIIEKVPILWCFMCVSSLSYSEILYKKINSFSYYFKIKFFNFFLIIWTTSIWSIINNQSIFFLKKQIYIIFKTKKESLIFLNFLLYKILKILKIKGKVISFLNFFFFLKKKYFIFLKKISIFYNKKNFFIENPNIDINIGSGFVHCSPSNGVEDYDLFINKKKIFNFFNKNFFIKKIKIFKNINLFFLNKIFFKFFKKRKIFLKLLKINHSYMFCWRHKKPIFYFLSKQTFINLNFKFKKKNIKNILINLIKKIFFFSKFYKKKFI